MAPSKDLMNMMARSVLTLYSYDSYADDIPFRMFCDSVYNLQLYFAF